MADPTLASEVDTHRFDRFVDGHPRGTFQQLSAWGELSCRRRGPVFRLGLEAGGDLRAAVQLMTVPFRRVERTMLWGPGGFLVDDGDHASERRLAESVRTLAAERDAVFVRISPVVRAGEDPDLVRRMAGAGFEHRAGRDRRTCPRYLTWVHLDRPIDEVFDGFAKKTRQYIRLARRRGVEVVEGDAGDLPRFEQMLQSTGTRRGFRGRSLPWLRDLHALFAREDRIRLLLAREGGLAPSSGRIIAGIIAVATAGHVAALLGPSEDRDHRATRLLHWEVIRWASERGASVCDLRGSGRPSPESDLYGLYRFKRGFRGELVEPVGEFDMVLDRPWYERLHDGDDELGRKQRKVFKEMRAET